MIDSKLSQEFVANLSALHDFKAQIIDRNGFIVASCCPQNVGNFHEEAYQMLQQNNFLAQQQSVPSEEGIATLYVPLTQNQHVVGLLQITGDEKTVRIYASAVKLSLETLMEHDLNSVKLQKYNSKTDLFIQKLLYDTQVSRSELESRAASLGYAYDCLRIPVFIVTDHYSDFSSLLQQGKNNPCYHSQDILTLSRSGNITLFIYLGYGEDVLRTYRDTVTEYLVWWQESLSALGFTYWMQVGTIQSNLGYYRIAYDHAVWLHNTARLQESVNWFYDHTETYLKRIVPLMEYRGIFSTFTENLSPAFLKTFSELIGTLAECNYSLQPASQKLYVHKNTLAFRIGKIKERLNINPMQDYRNRDFANNFCLYLKMILP
ncbi:MAG: hypothetical protein E7426_09325 [Ruminococcaceae bacterium]|nr:hypothetical protein [Oscillospiraceae bacterium]